MRCTILSFLSQTNFDIERRCGHKGRDERAARSAFSSAPSENKYKTHESTTYLSAQTKAREKKLSHPPSVTEAGARKSPFCKRLNLNLQLF